jgi:hypothetical protein
VVGTTVRVNVAVQVDVAIAEVTVEVGAVMVTVGQPPVLLSFE